MTPVLSGCITLSYSVAFGAGLPSRVDCTEAEAEIGGDMEDVVSKASAVVFRDDNLEFWWASPTEEEMELVESGGPLHMSFFQTHGGPFKTWQEADANALWTLCPPGQEIEVQIVGDLPGWARQ